MDRVQDYYNLIRPHYLARPDQFVHRLGTFKTGGIGNRPYPGGMPRVGVLHVPVIEASAGAKLHEKLDETRKELGLLDKRQTELEGKVSADSGRLGQIEHQLGRIDRKLDAITDRLIDIAGGH